MSIRVRSRKWVLALLVIVLATIGAFLPPIISIFFLGTNKPLVIISGVEWCSIVSSVVAFYVGGNVWQKREELKVGSINPEDTNCNGEA